MKSSIYERSVQYSGAPDKCIIDYLLMVGQLKRSLRVLNLEGNPVTRLPYYRMHILHRLVRKPVANQFSALATCSQLQYLKRSVLDLLFSLANSNACCSPN